MSTERSGGLVKETDRHVPKVTPHMWHKWKFYPVETRKIAAGVGTGKNAGDYRLLAVCEHCPAQLCTPLSGPRAGVHVRWYVGGKVLAKAPICTETKRRRKLMDRHVEKS